MIYSIQLYLHTFEIINCSIKDINIFTLSNKLAVAIETIIQFRNKVMCHRNFYIYLKENITI